MKEIRTLPVSREDYLALVKRVEVLEQMVREQLTCSTESAAEQTQVPGQKQDIHVLIQELQEEFAGRSSLTDALLAERRWELEREEANIASLFPHKRRGGTRHINPKSEI